MIHGDPEEIKKSERRIAKLATDKYKGVEFVDAPGRFCVVDGVFTINGSLWCFVEIKKRNIRSNQFDHIIIDKKKIDQAWCGARKLDLGFKLLFEFIDGAFIFTFDMDRDPADLFDSEVGGRTVNTRDKNDIDEVYKLPSKDWRKL